MKGSDSPPLSISPKENVAAAAAPPPPPPPPPPPAPVAGANRPYTREFRVANAEDKFASGLLKVQSSCESPLKASPKLGENWLPLPSGSCCRLLIPRQDHFAGLLCFAHGALGTALDVDGYGVTDRALRLGWMVLTVESVGPTWSSFGFRVHGQQSMHADTLRWNEALQQVLSVCSVLPERIVMAGFSDGASWALSFGLINGEFFNGGVAAFSPGRLSQLQGTSFHGSPRVFISHGKQDNTLPIHLSQAICADLQKQTKSKVEFRQVNSDHEITIEVLDLFSKWLGEMNE